MWLNKGCIRLKSCVSNIYQLPQEVPAVPLLCECAFTTSAAVSRLCFQVLILHSFCLLTCTGQLCLGLVDKPDQGTHPFLLRGIFNLNKIPHDSGDGVLHMLGELELGELRAAYAAPLPGAKSRVLWPEGNQQGILPVASRAAQNWPKAAWVSFCAQLPPWFDFNLSQRRKTCECSKSMTFIHWFGNTD